MRFRVPPKCPAFPAHLHVRHPLTRRLRFASSARNLQSKASVNGGTGNSEGSSYLVPGATVATLFMLGILHARRLYDDKKVEEAKEKGTEFEFSPDLKATFLKLLPLRSISRFWGFMTSLEIPVVCRPYVYKAWARAFHSNLEEIALPLDEYASLREFFVHSLKEGSRPINPDPHCLVSPVDGTILRFGELKDSRAMIEQVKGFSYSAISLLGANSFLPMIVQEDMHEESIEQESTTKDTKKKSWWRISLASPKMWNPATARPVKGVFYCVIYLKPGDYHRVHSPIDWNVFIRRHFSGRLYPVNERATRTIRNLFVENERVVLEGQWAEGYMAIAAIGATNIGSIELFIEPELQTNKPRKGLLHSEPPDERVYEPEGVGVMLRKGEEMAAFNMGSTVVLVFQAPASKSHQENGSSSEFKFCVSRGDRIRVGEALGSWTNRSVDISNRKLILNIIILRRGWIGLVQNRYEYGDTDYLNHVLLCFHCDEESSRKENLVGHIFSIFHGRSWFSGHWAATHVHDKLVQANGEGLWLDQQPLTDTCNSKVVISPTMIILKTVLIRSPSELGEKALGLDRPLHQQIEQVSRFFNEQLNTST